jgi:hypothetical protein
LIVHHDLDAVRPVLVPLAAYGDEQARDQADGEDSEQDAAVGHVAACSREGAPEPLARRNTKARCEAGLGAVA